jgi:hypothetical protein
MGGGRTVSALEPNKKISSAHHTWNNVPKPKPLFKVKPLSHMAFSSPALTQTLVGVLKW